jgi:hypothetical protein
VKEAGDLQWHDARLLEQPHVPQHLPRRPVGDDLTLPQDDDTIRVNGLLGLVLDDYEGDVVAVFEVFGDLEDAELPDGVEVRGRLVQAQYARLYSEHRGYGEALLLAA